MFFEGSSQIPHTTHLLDSLDSYITCLIIRANELMGFLAQFYLAGNGSYEFLGNS